MTKDNYKNKCTKKQYYKQSVIFEIILHKRVHYCNKRKGHKGVNGANYSALCKKVNKRLTTGHPIFSMGIHGCKAIRFLWVTYGNP